MPSEEMEQFRISPRLPGEAKATPSTPADPQSKGKFPRGFSANLRRTDKPSYTSFAVLNMM